MSGGLRRCSGDDDLGWPFGDDDLGWPFGDGDDDLGWPFAGQSRKRAVRGGTG
ncbi:hypothetical protein AB0D49_03115 [Streptomyces sp. NPDC048290]|uniref:hypothetical protein n=1 Tax=Streptomyces sp. NPDC048290 TaxID=3155811 RepID=UPI003436E678